MELAEAKKIAEERRREKNEDRLARQRVKEQIARDRAEREARQHPPPSSQPQSPGVAGNTVKKEYDSCRLQVCVCVCVCVWIIIIHIHDYNN